MITSKIIFASFVSGIFLYFTLPSTMGQFETAFFPVISEFGITEAKVVSVGWTEIYGEFEKLRDCPLNSLNMYYKSPNMNVPIQYLWLEAPKVRTDGHQEFGPWQIQVPVENIENVLVVTNHSCHIAYDTISVVGMKIE